MALLVGDVVTNFVANMDGMFAQLDKAGKKLDELAKKKFEIKVEVEDKASTVGLKRIAESVEKLNRVVGGVTEIVASGAEVSAKAIAKATGKSSVSVNSAINNVRRSLGGLDTASEETTSVWQKMANGFLRVGGVLTALSFGLIPNFVQRTSAGANTLKELAELAAGQAESSGNIVSRVILGTTALFLKAVTFGNSALKGAVATGLGLFAKAVGKLAQFRNELTGAAEGMGTMATTVSRGIGFFETLTNFTDLFFRSFVGNIGVALSTLFGFNIELERSTTFLRTATVWTGAFSQLSLALFGVQFIANRVFNMFGKFAAMNPTTTLGKASELVNTIYVGFLTLISPVTIVWNRLLATTSLLTGMGTVIFGLVGGWGSLATSISGSFMLIAGIKPLLSNVFAMTRLRFLQVSAFLGVGKAQFMLFLRGLRESFSILQKMVGQLGRIPKAFNLLAAGKLLWTMARDIHATLIGILETIGQSLPMLGMVGASSGIVWRNAQNIGTSVKRAGETGAVSVDELRRRFEELDSVGQKAVIGLVNAFDFMSNWMMSTFTNAFTIIKKANGVFWRSIGRTMIVQSKIAVGGAIPLMIKGFKGLWKRLPDGAKLGFSKIGGVFRTGWALISQRTEKFKKTYDSIWAPIRQKKAELAFKKIKGGMEKSVEESNRLKEAYRVASETLQNKMVDAFAGVTKAQTAATEAGKKYDSVMSRSMQTVINAHANAEEAVNKQKRAIVSASDAQKTQLQIIKETQAAYTKQNKVVGTAADAVMRLFRFRTARTPLQLLDDAKKKQADINEKIIEQANLIVTLRTSQRAADKELLERARNRKANLEEEKKLKKEMISQLETQINASKKLDASIESSKNSNLKFAKDELAAKDKLIEKEEALKKKTEELNARKKERANAAQALRDAEVLVARETALAQTREASVTAQKARLAEIRQLMLEHHAVEQQALQRENTFLVSKAGLQVKNAAEAADLINKVSTKSKEFNTLVRSQIKKTSDDVGDAITKGVGRIEGADGIGRVVAMAKTAGAKVVGEVKDVEHKAVQSIEHMAGEFAKLAAKSGGFGSKGGARFPQMFMGIAGGDAADFLVRTTRQVESVKKIYGKSATDFDAIMRRFINVAKQGGNQIAVEAFKGMMELRKGAKIGADQFIEAMQVLSAGADKEGKAVVTKLTSNKRQVEMLLIKMAGELQHTGQVTERQLGNWTNKLMGVTGANLKKVGAVEVNKALKHVVSQFAPYFEPHSDPPKLPLMKWMSKHWAMIGPNISKVASSAMSTALKKVGTTTHAAADMIFGTPFTSLLAARFQNLGQTAQSQLVHSVNTTAAATQQAVSGHVSNTGFWGELSSKLGVGLKEMFLPTAAQVQRESDSAMKTPLIDSMTGALVSLRELFAGTGRVTISSLWSKFRGWMRKNAEDKKDNPFVRWMRLSIQDVTVMLQPLLVPLADTFKSIGMIGSGVKGGFFAVRSLVGAFTGLMTLNPRKFFVELTNVLIGVTKSLKVISGSVKLVVNSFRTVFGVARTVTGVFAGLGRKIFGLGGFFKNSRKDIDAAGKSLTKTKEALPGERAQRVVGEIGQAFSRMAQGMKLSKEQGALLNSSLQKGNSLRLIAGSILNEQKRTLADRINNVAEFNRKLETTREALKKANDPTLIKELQGAEQTLVKQRDAAAAKADLSQKEQHEAIDRLRKAIRGLGDPATIKAATSALDALRKKTTGTDLGKKFLESVTGTPNDILFAVNKVFKPAAAQIKKMPLKLAADVRTQMEGAVKASGFTDAGKRIPQMISDGLVVGKSKIVGAASDLLHGIKDQLPASPPLFGPIGGNFLTAAGGKIVKMISFGLLSEHGTLASGMSKLLKTVSLPLLPGGIMLRAVSFAVKGINHLIESLRNLTQASPVRELNETAKAIRDIGHAAERIGMGDRIEEFNQFQQAAETLGVESSQLETIFVTLHRRLSDAASGNLEASASMERFGVNMDEFRNGTLSIVDVFRKLQLAYDENEHNLRGQQEILDMTGTTFGHLRTLMTIGAGEMTAALKEVEETGILVDAEAVERATALNRRVIQFHHIIDGIKRTLMNEVFPIVTNWFESVAHWWAVNRERVILGIQLIGTILDILVRNLTAKIQEWTRDSSEFFEVFAASFQFVFTSALELATVFFRNLWPIGKAVIQALFELIQPGFTFAFSYVTTVFLPRMLAGVLRWATDLLAEVVGRVQAVLFQIGNWMWRQAHGGWIRLKILWQELIVFMSETAASALSWIDDVGDFLGIGTFGIADMASGATAELARLRAELNLLDTNRNRRNFEEDFINARDNARAMYSSFIDDLEMLADHREVVVSQAFDNAAQELGQRVLAAMRMTSGAIENAFVDAGEALAPLWDNLINRVGLAGTIDQISVAIADFRQQIAESEDLTEQQRRDALALAESVTSQLSDEADRQSRIMSLLIDTDKKMSELHGSMSDLVGEGLLDLTSQRLDLASSQFELQNKFAELEASIDVIRLAARQGDTEARARLRDYVRLQDRLEAIMEITQRASRVNMIEALFGEGFGAVGTAVVNMAKLSMESDRIRINSQEIANAWEEASLSGDRFLQQQMLAPLETMRRLAEATGDSFYTEISDATVAAFRDAGTAGRGVAGALEVLRQSEADRENRKRQRELENALQDAATTIARSRADAFRENREAGGFLAWLGIGSGEEARLEIEAIHAEFIKKASETEEMFLSLREAAHAQLLDLNNQLVQAADEGNDERVQAIRRRIAEVSAQISSLMQEQSVMLEQLSVQEERAIAAIDRKKFEGLGAATASAFSDGFKEALDAAFDPENPDGFDVEKMMGGIFAALRDNLIDEMIQDVSESFESSLTTMFSNVFSFAGDLAGTLATTTMLIISSLLAASDDKLNATREQIADVVETTEKVRGIISGETTVRLKEVSDQLADALEPTNNILRGIRQDLRLVHGTVGGLEPTVAGTGPV